ncbi:hypothetical protein E2C01_096536 [Portunus trituberculatus]|uniref:Uncharacterized protein n=1 Tax=Portunus trituberculatus TaxID=210409 RepID=A0A5B7K295_PORTR|nr:hypothetical protein [Portunus trituberculatus]
MVPRKLKGACPGEAGAAIRVFSRLCGGGGDCSGEDGEGEAMGE